MPNSMPGASGYSRNDHACGGYREVHSSSPAWAQVGKTGGLLLS